jgi:hypothetical protein
MKGLDLSKSIKGDLQPLGFADETPLRLFPSPGRCQVAEDPEQVLHSSGSFGPSAERLQVGNDDAQGRLDMRVRKYHIGAGVTRPRSANTWSYSGPEHY